MKKTKSKYVAMILSSVIFTQISSCKTNNYIWAENIKTAQSDTARYTIQSGDQLHITVWKHEQLSTSTTVRSDGMIAMPLIGEITAENTEPSHLREHIKTRLSSYIIEPEVHIAITGTRATHSSVIGEVNRPGKYQLEPDDHILHLIAKSGGLTEFADPDSIYLIRPSKNLRIRFRFSDLSSGKKNSLSHKIMDGDIVYVE